MTTRSRRSSKATVVRNLSGWKPDRPDHRDLTFSFPFRRRWFLPKEVDFRGSLPRVEDQGDIGSCTAHAATSAIEFLYRKEKRDQPELSRLFLYYATRVYVANGLPSDDDGASIRDVMKALAVYGTCLETDWSYVTKNYSKTPPAKALVNAKDHQILRYSRCPNLLTTRICLKEGYPVVGGFSVPAGMMSKETSKTGVIHYPEKSEDFMGGHAVLFCGYDDKKKHLIFKNSWGPGWGEKGYGYLPYDFVTNGLAHDFWTIRKTEM